MTIGAVRRRGALLVLLCLAEFLIALDFSIVNVALPDLGAELGFSPSGLQWVIGAYALTFGGFLVLGGRVADLYGRRRLLIAGLAGFAVASLGAGIATSAEALIAFRAIQGLAAAAIAPAALSLLTTTFTEPAERQRAMGAWSAVLGAGFVVGVAAGGPLTEFVTWRSTFLVAVPIAVVLAVATARMVPESRAESGRHRLDLAGALLVTTGVSALAFALSRATVVGWISVPTMLALACAAVLLAGFVAVERRSPAPVISLAMLRLRPVALSNTVNVLLMGAFNGMIFVLTLFLQQVHGSSALVTGLTFAPAGICGMLAGIAAGALATRFGAHRTLIVSAFVQALATAALISLPSEQTVTFIIVATMVTNFSGVVAIVMVTIAAVSSVPDAEQGVAGGLLNTSQQIGGALGLAVVTAAITAVTTSAAAPSPEVLLSGLRAGMVVAAGLVLVAAALSTVTMAPRRIPAPTMSTPTAAS